MFDYISWKKIVIEYFILSAGLVYSVFLCFASSSSFGWDYSVLLFWACLIIHHGKEIIVEYFTYQLELVLSFIQLHLK